METWDAVRARRNIREFADRAIAEDHLRRIAEAGRRAPSSRNRQPWDFVVVSDREHLIELAQVWRGAAPVAGSAATIACAGPVLDDERQRDWLLFDMGQAMMAMMIVAADLGIGSGHSAVEDQALARSILGLPGDRVCIALMPLGYPRDRPLKPIRHPNRRPFDDVVHRERLQT